LESLLRLLQDNPSFMQGFLGGVVGAIVVNFVTWRWTISRRKHED
jgi:hypothetical protein